MTVRVERGKEEEHDIVQQLPCRLVVRGGEPVGKSRSHLHTGDFGGVKTDGYRNDCPPVPHELAHLVVGQPTGVG
jgi:hypothetical protein